MFASDLLARTAVQLSALVTSGELEEICNGNEA